MSTDDEKHLARLGCTITTNMSTIKKIHSQTLDGEACQAIPVKMITNKDTNLSSKDCVAGKCYGNCGCKKDIATKLSACDQIQSIETRCEECNKAFMLNNEEILLSTLNFSGEALFNKTMSEQSKSVNGETHIAYEGCAREMSTDVEIYSQNSLCTCQPLNVKMLNNEEIYLPALNFSCNGPLTTKTMSAQRQSPSCETHFACERCSTKMATDGEIHSRSSSNDALQTKISTVEEIQIASLSFSDDTLINHLLPDSDHTLCQSQSPSSEKCISCKTAEKILTNEALLASRFNNKALTFSNQSPSLTSENRIPVPPAETSTDEEVFSRSSVCESLLKTILSTKESPLAPPSYSGKTPCTNMLSDKEQSLRSRPKTSVEGSQSLCPEWHILPKNSSTDSPNAQIKAMGTLSPLDPSSYSRPELAIIKHMSLNLNVDFAKQVLSGQAKIDFDVLLDINELVLDVSKLKIESIEAEDGSKLDFKVGEHLANMGSKLTITLPQQLTVGEKITVNIKYSTDPQASALQWLDPEQTSGKKHPYLFSQCQPIHARSIVPCQDTPAVKFTYDAEVTAPEEFTVLMSALRGEQRSNKTTFRQPMPLPSYLVALAVGVLESRTLGPRSKVWSEKEEIERSAWEFSETEKYLQAAEKLCGPYEWTQYDLLVLPPSFPYGGMENPCLTFVTPTLLAGDRSQADVIVHEIMHSWTGNLVTNRNFEHFWLNEGFTVFLERKVGASLINDSVEAKRSRDFQSLLGLQELNEAIQVFGSTSPLTNLVVDLDGIHPDDAFSRVPYEKGSLFLRFLEDLAGGPEVFDDFLRAYLTKFRKKSLDTEQFRRFFVNYFKDNEALKSVDWDTWLYRAGMPPVIPAYDTTMTKAISAVLSKIADPTAKLSYEDVETFTPHQMIHMLQQLIDSPATPIDRLTTLGTEYRVNGNKNTEILYRWLRLCIRSRDQSKISEVFNFVNSQGRMKYVRPIYRDLYAWEEVRQQAIDNFLKNEKYMMHVSAYTLRKDLHLAETNTATKE